MNSISQHERDLMIDYLREENNVTEEEAIEMYIQLTDLFKNNLLQLILRDEYSIQ